MLPSNPLSESPILTSFMFAEPDDIFSPKFYPIFGAGKFPIDYHYTLMIDSEIDSCLKDLFALYPKLTIEWCQEWNSFVSSTTGYTVPYNLSGICLKDDKPELCKAGFYKFSCKGCGKVWCPHSLDYSKYKTCVKSKDPWWTKYLDVDKIVQENGGPQEKPLVWCNGQLIRLGKEIKR